MLEYAQKNSPKLIAVQIPEGLKTRAQEISREIEEKTGAQTLLFIDPIFGACMLADDKAHALGAELLVHLGHNRFYKESMPTIYIPVNYQFTEKQLEDTAQKIIQIAQKKKFHSIGLVSVIQTTHALPKIQKKIEQENAEISVLIGKENGFMSSGQVLGCNYSTASLIAKDVNAIFYIGDGRFHPIGLVIETKKPVFTINPFSGETKEISNEREAFYKKRITMIANAQSAKTFGILVSTEKGQFGITKARLVKKTIETEGKKAIILVGDLLKPDYLAGIRVDALVNTACPRIATDDSANYGVPVLSMYELEFALGKKDLKEFKLENTL